MAESAPLWVQYGNMHMPDRTGWVSHMSRSTSLVSVTSPTIVPTIPLPFKKRPNQPHNVSRIPRTPSSNKPSNLHQSEKLSTKKQYHMESLPVPWPRLAGDLKRFASNKRDRPDLGTGSNLTWLTISLTRNLT